MSENLENLSCAWIFSDSIGHLFSGAMIHLSEKLRCMSTPP